MAPSLALDHLVIVAETLGEGTALVEEALGVTLSGVGCHDRMGTHNCLLSLGPDAYLEVIAIDPDAAPPPYPRWFNLDAFSGPPRLTHWVCRTDDIEAMLAMAPKGSGKPMSLTRDVYRWRFAVPADGKLPYDGAMPALIQWDCSDHPADKLADQGVRLRRLDIIHPDGDAFLQDFPVAAQIGGVAIGTGAAPGFRAVLETPGGVRVVQ